jgi:hypothetical protein
LNRYTESVAAPRWFLVLIAALALGALAGAILVIRDPDGASSGVLFAMMLLVAVALLSVVIVFGRLRVEVRESLRFHFGPFGRTLEAADVRSATVERYPWMTFGGWGIRLGWWHGGLARAYSVPFLRTGVAIETAEGKHYYVSSQRPDELAVAIQAWTGSREGVA